MTAKTKLLALRRKAKRRKPEFVVKESRHTARIKVRWRLPRGRHSAARQRHCGRPAQPHPGYGSPLEVRGLDRSGLRPAMVCTEKDLLALDPTSQAAVISSTVGKKKRMLLLQLAVETKIKVLFVKDPQASSEAIKSAFALRQKEKAARKVSKSKKQEEKKKKSEETEKQKKEEAEKSKKENKESSDRVSDRISDNISEEGTRGENPEKTQREAAEKVIIKKQ